jgi:Ni2+-binding GTPase involved in maturation of urease and hydrogenase
MKMEKNNPVNIYLTGGFLGSGKTTAIINAVKQVLKTGRKLAVITNDQGDQQVDSDYFKSLPLLHAEVANGCFCCNYDNLEKKIVELMEAGLPEIIFAESVGSCTDLVATIAKPFGLFHPEFRVVISVFADAFLVHSIITGTYTFLQESVHYIYKKQLEEADLLVINKTDLITEVELNTVKEHIQTSCPGKIILCQDSSNDNDIGSWLNALADFIPGNRTSLDLDYDIYGAGEAALAWFDQRLSIHTVMPVAVDAAMRLMNLIYYRVRQAGLAIGHLKFLIRDGDWVRKISYTGSVAKNDLIMGEHSCKHLSLLINARVQTTPDTLQQIIGEAIHEIMMATGCRVVEEKVNAFRPGYPRPLHRMED